MAMSKQPQKSRVLYHPDRLERTKDGISEIKVYAYIDQRHSEDFGLLEAVSYADARRYLGATYRIKAIWMLTSEFLRVEDDGDKKRPIVARALQR